MKRPSRNGVVSVPGPNSSSIRYGKPLAWNTVVPATGPQAPTMASQGEVSTSGSGSTTRAPGISSRVKQSCIERNLRVRASLRSRSVNSFHMPIDALLTIGLRILLNLPMKCVSAMRGTRLVSRKFRSSCASRRRNCFFIGFVQRARRRLARLSC